MDPVFERKPRSLKHVPVSWNSLREYIQWRLRFFCTLFLDHPLGKHSNSLLRVSATLAEYMSCPSLYISTRLPRWITAWLPIGQMSKASYSGSTSLKRPANWSVGLLNTCEIIGIRAGDRGHCPRLWFLSGHCFTHGSENLSERSFMSSEWALIRHRCT